MRKDGRRRSKAGLKFDFSGGEAEKSWTTGNNFLLQEKTPNMPRCHGYWRRIQNCWKNMSRGMQARRRWNRWFQLLVLTLDAFWAVDWEAVREVEETVEGDPREEQPVILEGVRKFLQSYICFESDLAPHSWQYHHKYSSGRDKHEVLAEMKSHLGDSSTKATDKGQVGWEQLSEPIHMRAKVIKGEVRRFFFICSKFLSAQN